ncbi:MAG: hypothetical protein O3A10_11750 [Chloroflexi bacterium]|nr:hypothetical protein [Chloroflexota bacterium]MDA1147192.1 hypothetical protein [Chloroflexota bacterium]
MTAVPLADPAAERVGALVADAFRAVLADRLEALLVHGSAVTGGYIEGYSDFDFVVFMRGSIGNTEARALQARLGEADHTPFEYLQVSRVVDLDAPPQGEARRLLIEGAYAALVGDYPQGWPFLDADALTARGAEVLAALPAALDRKRRHWAAATGARRTLEVRYHMTDLKPAVRAHLVVLGEPALEVWRAPYPELARRWSSREAAEGARFAHVLASLPAAHDREAAVGEELLALIEAISEAHQ